MTDDRRDPDPAVAAEVAAQRGVLELLAVDCCPACRTGLGEETRSIRRLLDGSLRSTEALMPLRASLGWCPRHSRQLRVEPGARDALPAIYSQVAIAAVAAVGTGGASDACPICASVRAAEARTIRVVVGGILDAEVREAYEEGSGFCLAHFEVAVGQASRAAVQVLARRVLVKDESASLSGPDPDASERAKLRERIPPDPGSTTSTLAALHVRLEVDACPACLTASRTELRYLRWVVQDLADPSATLADEVGGFCATHLADLAAIEPDAADWVARRIVPSWRKTALGLDALPARRPLSDGLLRVFHVRGARGLALALRPLTTRRACPVCTAADGSAARELDLLLRALADPRTARRYDLSHGLCLRHARQLAARPTQIVRVVSRRLSDLAFALQAASPESGAWLRLPDQIDGRVSLGCPSASAAGLVSGDPSA